MHINNYKECYIYFLSLSDKHIFKLNLNTT